MSRQITKLTTAHDAMIDVLITNPRVTNEQLAAEFGMTASWVASLRHTDLFRRRIAERREELVDPVLIATIEEKIRAATDLAVEHILTKLTAKIEDLSDQFVLRAAEFGSKAMGLGSGDKAPPEIPPDHLQDLAKRLIALQSSPRRAAQAEDVRFTEGAPGLEGHDATADADRGKAASGSDLC